MRSGFLSQTQVLCPSGFVFWSQAFCHEARLCVLKPVSSEGMPRVCVLKPVFVSWSHLLCLEARFFCVEDRLWLKDKIVAMKIGFVSSRQGAFGPKHRLYILVFCFGFGCSERYLAPWLTTQSLRCNTWFIPVLKEMIMTVYWRFLTAGCRVGTLINGWADPCSLLLIRLAAVCTGMF